MAPPNLLTIAGSHLTLMPRAMNQSYIQMSLLGAPLFSFGSHSSLPKAHGGLRGECLVDLIDVDVLHLQPSLEDRPRPWCSSKGGCLF